MQIAQCPDLSCRAHHRTPFLPAIFDLKARAGVLLRAGTRMLASSKFRKGNSDGDLFGLTARLRGTYGSPKASRKPHSLGAGPAWTGTLAAYQARGAHVARIVDESSAVTAALESSMLEHASRP